MISRSYEVMPVDRVDSFEECLVRSIANPTVSQMQQPDARQPEMRQSGPDMTGEAQPVRLVAPAGERKVAA